MTHEKDGAAVSNRVYDFLPEDRTNVIEFHGVFTSPSSTLTAFPEVLFESRWTHCPAFVGPGVLLTHDVRVAVNGLTRAVRLRSKVHIDECDKHVFEV